jgi:predicted GH43/DUF377 family glycosyl hydrolase
MKINKTSIKIFPSANAVITQFLNLPGESRVKNIIEKIKRFTEAGTNESLADVIKNFSGRHRNIEKIFLENFGKVNMQLSNQLNSFSQERKLLTGSFFTKEYSIQAAALFNPSIVAHPNQHDLKPGELRFIMSLRATGEGHISSIVFKTGIIDDRSNIFLDETPQYFTPLKKNNEAVYNKDFIKKRLSFFPDSVLKILGKLPDDFTANEALDYIKNNFSDDDVFSSVKILEEIFDTNYELKSTSQSCLDEKVIFPNSEAESMGMEDARFVKFDDENGSCYYGTYTAYDGKQIKTQLIETKDFDIFKIRTLYGAAISDKGMALFPQKVNGKYVMIARQGGEKISIMFSEDLYFWNDYRLLMKPKYEWELVQLGNCGSPIKTDKGWLLLTHGVGAMRTYVISAILLSLDNPSKIIARLKTPLIKADEAEREGYVPNVVYTCGFLRHGNTLIIPYAVSDSATAFATIDLNELLDEMKND